MPFVGEFLVQTTTILCQDSCYVIIKEKAFE